MPITMIDIWIVGHERSAIWVNVRLAIKKNIVQNLFFQVKNSFL